MELSRRDTLRLAGLGTAGLLIGGRSLSAALAKAEPTATAANPPCDAALTSGGATDEFPADEPSQYALPPLPYAYDALEPVLDARTVELHHAKHHAAYVKSANGALDQLRAARAKGDFAAIKALSGDLAFAASGVVLHDLYWRSMNPKAPPEPAGSLASRINRDFGSAAVFKAQFAAAAKAVQGSGWALLAYDPAARTLVILQVEKHQNLTIWGVAPLLVCDVWEHAYYLKYQSRRPDYVEAWLGLIDWPAAAARYELALRRR